MVTLAGIAKRPVVAAAGIEGTAGMLQNIAEQNIHSLEVEGGTAKNIVIDGKAEKINNLATGVKNEALQSIGGVKVE